MNGWIKKFSDGTLEVGSDLDVEKKKASWRKGRLSDMIGAEVIHNGKKISISAPGTYWQSDDYEVTVLSPESKMAVRRLQYKLQGKVLEMTVTDKAIVFTVTDKEDALWSSLTGQWLTVELDIDSGIFNHYVQENPR